MPCLEITTMIGCPLMCTYCPQDALRNSYGRDPDKYLSLDRFRDILAKVPSYVRIDFSGMSEPWANPEATGMLRHTLEDGRNVAIYTTLYGIDCDEAHRVTGLLYDHRDKVEVLCLHLPDQAGNMRGFKPSPEFDDVLAQFVWFGREHLPDRFQMMTMDPNGQLHRSLRGVLPEGWQGNTRAGNVDTEELRKPAIEATPRHDVPVGCSFTALYDHNVLLPNGDVVLCCMDYSVKHKLGNLVTGDYWSLFDSDTMHRLLALNRKPEFSKHSLCKTCTRAVRYEIDPAAKQFWKHTVSEGVAQ